MGRWPGRRRRGDNEGSMGVSMYSFPPGGSLGVMMGLSRAQVVALGGAIGVFVVGAMSGRLVAGVVAAGVVAVVGAGQWAGVPLRTRIGQRFGWVSSSGSRRWRVPVGRRRSPVQFPPCLRGFSVEPVAGVGDWQSGPPVGLIKARGSISVVVPVEGPQLALLGEDGVDQRLREWGDVLGSLCAERGEGGIARVSWTDVHAAADSRAAFVYHRDRGRVGSASGDYEDHLEACAADTSDHRVYVTVTLSSGSARRRRSLSPHRKADYALAAVEQTLVVARELSARGYRVGRALSPVEVAQLVRRIGDPWRPRRDVLSAVERLGVPEPDDVAPANVVNDRLFVGIDSALHRAYQIDWPNRAVAGDWMWALLAAAGGPKVTTVIFEPVAPSASRHRVEHQLNRLSSDAQVEANRKNRVSARRRAMAAAVADREEELVAGHMEMETFGLVVLAERELAALDQRCQRLEREAVRCGGARLRPLDTLHDVGWAAALPIAMPVGRPQD